MREKNTLWISLEIGGSQWSCCHQLVSGDLGNSNPTVLLPELHVVLAWGGLFSVLPVSDITNIPQILLQLWLQIATSHVSFSRSLELTYQNPLFVFTVLINYYYFLPLCFLFQSEFQKEMTVLSLQKKFKFQVNYYFLKEHSYFISVFL